MTKPFKKLVSPVIGLFLIITPYYIIKFGNTLYLGDTVVEKIIQKQIDADIAIFGSSVAWVQFNPQVIEERVKLDCYNFGTNGTTLVQYKGLIREYLNYSKSSIIVIAGSFSEFEPRDKIMEVYKYSDYLSNPNIFESLYEIDPNLVWKLRNIPFYDLITFDQYTYIRAAKGFLNGSYQADYKEYKGYAATDKEWENVDDNSSIVAKIDNNRLLDYERIINEINSNGKTAVIVLTPIYIDGQAQILNLEELRKVYESLAGPNNIFLDFTKSAICQRKELFYNNTHLNAAGAILFSEEFSKKILESGLHNI